MTIRRAKKNRKLSTKPDPDILSDDRTRFIIENMTARHARLLNDLFTGESHSSPTCVCWLCLWRKYEKTRPIGHPYDFLTFLAYDILAEVTDAFQYESIKQIPIKKLAKQVIGRLPNVGDKTKVILNESSREFFEAHFIKYNRQKRYQSDKFLNLREQLMYQIHREAGRYVPVQEFGPKLIRGLIRPSKPKAIHILRPSTRALLPSKIAQYVYSQPDHKATQRQLQRHTNKLKADLEETHEWLKWRYGIIVPPHEKWESTIYKGTRPLLLKSPPGRKRRIQKAKR
jgi:hypothetical protein